MASRQTYDQIRADLLSIYHRGCIEKGTYGWTPEQVCSWAYSELDGSYPLPIENLMLEVAALGLTGLWYQNQVSFHLDEIRKILSENVESDLFSSLESSEADELKTDMRSLRIIS